MHCLAEQTPMKVEHQHIKFRWLTAGDISEGTKTEESSKNVLNLIRYVLFGTGHPEIC